MPSHSNNSTFEDDTDMSSPPPLEYVPLPETATSPPAVESPRPEAETDEFSPPLHELLNPNRYNVTLERTLFSLGLP